MSDLISRGKAIEDLQNGDPSEIYEIEDIKYWLNSLPSAEPQIIRCKDCKHYGCVLYSGTQFEYGECFGHEESDYTFEVKPDDFCSRAERRTDE